MAVLRFLFFLPNTYSITLHIVVSQGTVTVLTARQIGSELIHYIDSFPDDNLVISSFQQLLSQLQSRIIAFEQQVFQIYRSNYLI